MSDLKYKLVPTTKKPDRRYRKGSKYDAVLEAIQKSSETMGVVSIPDLRANYIRTQLQKRIKVLGVKNIKLSVVNDKCYYEKTIQPEKATSKPDQPEKATTSKPKK